MAVSMEKDMQVMIIILQDYTLCFTYSHCKPTFAHAVYKIITQPLSSYTEEEDGGGRVGIGDASLLASLPASSF